MTTPSEEQKRCCDEPMIENSNQTGIRCAKKCGYWEARPPYIKVEIVNGSGIQRGHRAVLFDDTRISPMKVSPCEVEESWAIDVKDLIDNPAIASALAQTRKEGREETRVHFERMCFNIKSDSDRATMLAFLRPKEADRYKPKGI